MTAMAKCCTGRGEIGFALVEELVALAVIGAVAAMFLEVVQSWAMARDHVHSLRAATLIAQSRLAQAVAEPRRDASGTDGPFTWHASLSGYPGTANGPGLELVAVTVRQSATGRTVADLRTLRLAR